MPAKAGVEMIYPYSFFLGELLLPTKKLLRGEYPDGGSCVVLAVERNDKITMRCQSGLVLVAVLNVTKGGILNTTHKCNTASLRDVDELEDCFKGTSCEFLTLGILHTLVLQALFQNVCDSV